MQQENRLRKQYLLVTGKNKKFVGYDVACKAYD